MDNPGGEDTGLIQSSQKGETHPVVRSVRDLLDNRQMRTLLYGSLILLTIFPVFLDSVDIFGHGKDQYVGNALCDDDFSCGLAFTSCLIMFAGIILVFVLLVRSFTYTEAKVMHRIRNIALFGCLLLGNIILLATVLVMTFKEDTDPKRACFMARGSNHYYCRVSYFGNNIVGPILILCAILDIKEVMGDDSSLKNYLILRMMCFASTLFVSSLCILLNLFENYHAYHTYVLANTSYALVCIGYLLVMLVTFCVFILQCCNCCATRWELQRRVAKLLGFGLLIGVLFIQARTYADIFVFCIMCLVLAADIQVVKET